MSTDLADTAVTPALLLDEVRRARAEVDAREARIMQIAVEWAHSHPAVDGEKAWAITGATAVPLSELDGTVLSMDVSDEASEEAVEWSGIPPVAWHAPASFAAANGMSTASGKALIRDALILRHRLPKTWQRIVTGQATSWRGRRVAEAVIAAPADVVAYVDDLVAPQVGTIGAAALDRLVDKAMLELHAEARELDDAAAPDAHYVDLEDQPLADGSFELRARGDRKDLHDFDKTVADVAAALRANGDQDPLDARRARALGVLADPARAHALLSGQPAPAPSKQAVLHLHLTDLGLLGIDPVAHDETARRAILAQQVQRWLGRTDTHVTVKPVLDLAEDLHTESYAVPDRLREQTVLLHPTCVFPWCTRPARRCDCDHIDPWDADPENPDGATCSHNLAPLCRHHHRLKTLAGWSYRRLDTRLFWWTDPHGFHYLRDRGGTSIVSQT